MLLLPRAVGHSLAYMLCQQQYRLTSIEFVYEHRLWCTSEQLTRYLFNTIVSAPKRFFFQHCFFFFVVSPSANFELWQFYYNTYTRYVIHTQFVRYEFVTEFCAHNLFLAMFMATKSLKTLCGTKVHIRKIIHLKFLVNVIESVEVVLTSQ